MTFKYFITDQEFIEGKVMVIEEEVWSESLVCEYLKSDAKHLRFPYGPGLETLNYSFLTQFPPESVEGIEIYSYAAVDISPLAHFTNLKGISLGPYKGKLDLSKWQNLEVLQLKYKNTVREFVDLPKLHTLYMDNIPGEDFSMIAGMKQLVNLSIHGGKQVSANGLQHLDNLKYLELYRLKSLKDWSALTPQNAIQRMNVQKCGGIDYAPSKEAFLKAVKQAENHD